MTRLAVAVAGAVAAVVRAHDTAPVIPASAEPLMHRRCGSNVCCRGGSSVLVQVCALSIFICASCSAQPLEFTWLPCCRQHVQQQENQQQHQPSSKPGSHSLQMEALPAEAPSSAPTDAAAAAASSAGGGDPLAALGANASLFSAQVGEGGNGMQEGGHRGVSCRQGMRCIPRCAHMVCVHAPPPGPCPAPGEAATATGLQHHPQIPCLLTLVLLPPQQRLLLLRLPAGVL